MYNLVSYWSAPAASFNLQQLYSNVFNISNCFSTLVCDVSRISPAKNISSTTVYTLKKLNTKSNSHTL